MNNRPTMGSLFAGIGGFDLGFERAGFRTAWQVEIDPFCRRVLEKHWPAVRRHDDVRTFPPSDPGEWRVDVICGGFPCQDISVAGKGRGLAGKRSGLWSEFARIIRVVRPRVVVVENVAALLYRGMGTVLGDLAACGFDAEWDCLSAASLGAPHLRERMFIVAHRHGRELHRGVFARRPPENHLWWSATQAEQTWDGRFAELESMGLGTRISSYADARGILDGIPDRLDRMRGVGNVVLPQIAEWIATRIMRFFTDQPSSPESL